MLIHAGNASRWDELQLPPRYASVESDDVDRCEWAQLLGQSGEFGAFTEEELDSQVLSCLIPDAAAFVKYGGSLVACASVCVPREFHPAAVLMFVFVHPAHRGLQLGEVVTRRAIRRAAAAGYDRILLHTDDTRIAAIRVYLRIGFKPSIHHRSHRRRWRAVYEVLDGGAQSTQQPARVFRS